MAYKYQWLHDINAEKVKALGLTNESSIINDAFIESFVHELTYKQDLLLTAIENETHNDIEQAKTAYADAERRTTFMLGMIDAVWTIDPEGITDDQHRTLVYMAYGRDH